MTLSWERDGTDWPYRAASRFVVAGGLRWHVQVIGDGPDVVLLHGTGASGHSWRRVVPLLPDARLIVPDLPGHGFSERLPSASTTLPGIARAIMALLKAIGVEPAVSVGHSAGAAILARMALDGVEIGHLVSVNGAILPLGGAGSSLFSPIARALATAPVVPWLFSRRAADPKVVDKLLRGTGSTLDAEGVALYARLVRHPDHVTGALAMMAGWDLPTLGRELTRLAVPLTLIVGTNDRTVPPGDSERLLKMFPHAHLIRLPGLGHLAHEERPAIIGQVVTEILAEARRPSLTGAARL